MTYNEINFQLILIYRPVPFHTHSMIQVLRQKCWTALPPECFHLYLQMRILISCLFKCFIQNWTWPKSTTWYYLSLLVLCYSTFWHLIYEIDFVSFVHSQILGIFPSLSLWSGLAYNSRHSNYKMASDGIDLYTLLYKL